MNDTAYATEKVLYVSTSSYASDSSDYVSSVIDDETPFPSLTKSQKFKLNELIHGRKSTPNVSTFTQDMGEVSDMSFKEETQTKTEEVKNSCCCLC